jgi:hypothetical protein
LAQLVRREPQHRGALASLLAAAPALKQRLLFNFSVRCVLMRVQIDKFEAELETISKAKKKNVSSFAPLCETATV